MAASTQLFVIIGLYALFCLAASRRGVDPLDGAAYFVADRALGPTGYFFAVTASGLALWAFLLAPAAVHGEGVSWAPLALAAVVAPFAATLFAKRQWLLARQYGFVTLGELLGYCFGSEALRGLAALIAILFAIPLLAAGLAVLADAAAIALPATTAGDGASFQASPAIATAAAVLIFLAATRSGLRGAARVDVLNFFLVTFGLVVSGLVAIFWAGGFDGVMRGLADIAREDPGFGHVDPRTGGLGAGFLFSLALAFFGLFASPAFASWTFAARSVGPFAPQQIWGAGAVFGLAILLFSVIQGAALAVAGVDAASDGASFAAILERLAATAPWFLAIVAAAGLAAVASAGGAVLAAGAGAARDLAVGFVDKEPLERNQIAIARISAALVVLLALLIALSDERPDALTLFVIAGGFSLQLAPALVGACRWGRLRSGGVVWGLIAGLIVYWLTEPVMQPASVVGAWMPANPFGLHAAFWGLSVNFALAIGLSLIDRAHDGRRDEVADFLDMYAGHGAEDDGRDLYGWFLAALWTIFAFGPGAYFGEILLGDPRDVDSWIFFMQPVLAYQLLMWATGCAVLYFFGAIMAQATPPEVEIEEGPRDIRDLLGVDQRVA